MTILSSTSLNSIGYLLAGSTKYFNRRYRLETAAAFYKQQTSLKRSLIIPKAIRNGKLFCIFFFFNYGIIAPQNLKMFTERVYPAIAGELWRKPIV
jgi:hypothetical protein